MAQQLIIGATQVAMEFEAGTQEVGFHRFTDQVGAGPVDTNFETVDSTIFGPFTAAETHTITYATIGTDGVTVLGPVVSTTQAIGAQVVLQVAAGLTVQVVTIP